MELFLLIAIGITVISFISIALTKPSPASMQELIPEPAEANLIMEENATARGPSTELDDINLEVDKQQVNEEILMPLA